MLNMFPSSPSGSLLILSGPSGVGKSSIIAELLKKGYYCVRSYTTRNMRDGESQGNPYHFISEEEFMARRERKEFMIGQEMNGNHYGARTDDFREAIRQGKNVVFDMDARKLDAVKTQFPSLVSCFILPESIDILEQRMKSRVKDGVVADLKERLEHSKEMLKSNLNTDYFIVNKEGELNATVGVISSIVEAHAAKDDQRNNEFKLKFFKEKNKKLCISLGIPVKIQENSYRFVLTGAPCSGKTTTLNALRERFKDHPDYHFIDEIPTQYIQEKQREGINPFEDLITFERTVMTRQVSKEDAAQGSYTFIDRSMYDHVAISSMLEIGKADDIDIAGELLEVAHKRKYTLVFMLDRLAFEATEYRREHDESDVIRQESFLKATYSEHVARGSFRIVNVPVNSIDERVDLIMREVDKLTQDRSAAQLPLAGLMASPRSGDSDAACSFSFNRP